MSQLTRSSLSTTKLSWCIPSSTNTMLAAPITAVRPLMSTPKASPPMKKTSPVPQPLSRSPPLSHLSPPYLNSTITANSPSFAPRSQLSAQASPARAPRMPLVHALLFPLLSPSLSSHPRLLLRHNSNLLLSLTSGKLPLPLGKRQGRDNNNRSLYKVISRRSGHR